MTFSEFLSAMNEESLENCMDQYEFDQEIGEILHQRLLELLRSYKKDIALPGIAQVLGRVEQSHCTGLRIGLARCFANG